MDFAQTTMVFKPNMKIVPGSTYKNYYKNYSGQWLTGPPVTVHLLVNRFQFNLQVTLFYTSNYIQNDIQVSTMPCFEQCYLCVSPFRP